MKITKVWKNTIKISSQEYDMLELDEKYYLCVPNNLSYNDILEAIRDGQRYDRYTIEELKEQRSSHANLKAMWENASKWVYRCACGAAKVKTTHSYWCPQYGGDKV